MIATSNVAPDNLYRDGLNRGLFLPFIDLLKANAEIISLDTDTDYRLMKTDGSPVWISPLGPEADAAMAQAWNQANGRGRRRARRGRRARAARFRCRQQPERRPVSASPTFASSRSVLPTILRSSSAITTLFVDHVPHLGPHVRNETKRFILLVDTLYDHGARLFASAAAEPQNLLTLKKGTEGFEFDRTVSRLIEMQSAGICGRSSCKILAAS